jgi:hypothetical protein
VSFTRRKRWGNFFRVTWRHKHGYSRREDRVDVPLTPKDLASMLREIAAEIEKDQE